MENKILYFTLKKQWFELISSGAKREEYREIKPYWIKRLIGSDNEFIPFTHVHFRLGYHKNAPEMMFKIISINRGRGLVEFGAPENRDVFIIRFE